ncbi:class II aaRS and biotin synthetase, partial [Nadsonia fulvescens var. elongata DSM 6958]
MDKMPNRISSDVPTEQKTLGYINIEAKTPVVPYNHVDIGLKLGLIDIASASKISGTSWYFLMGDAVALELALVQYAMSKARKRGFINIMPPSIVKQEVAHACGFKPRDLNGEQQIYNLAFQGAELCLTGTAEIPLAGWGINKVFDANMKGDDIPVKLVGVNRSYRAEAGARGADTKGLYRVHEFTKVELFAYVKGEDTISQKMLEEILDLQKEIIQDLGLCARILILPADDLGNPAYKKYDI